MEAVGGHLGFPALLEEVSGGSPPLSPARATHIQLGETLPACEELRLEEPGKCPQTRFPHVHVPAVHLGFCSEQSWVGPRCLSNQAAGDAGVWVTPEREGVQDIWEK